MISEMSKNEEKRNTRIQFAQEVTKTAEKFHQPMTYKVPSKTNLNHMYVTYYTN